MLTVLAVIVAALWSFTVNTAIPFIEAVRDAIFQAPPAYGRLLL